MKAIIFFSVSLTYLDADIHEGASVLKKSFRKGSCSPTTEVTYLI